MRLGTRIAQGINSWWSGHKNFRFPFWEAEIERAMVNCLHSLKSLMTQHRACRSFSKPHPKDAPSAPHQQPASLCQVPVALFHPTSWHSPVIQHGYGKPQFLKVNHPPKGHFPQFSMLYVWDYLKLIVWKSRDIPPIILHEGKHKTPRNVWLVLLAGFQFFIAGVPHFRYCCTSLIAGFCKNV